jgi:hypothetical protein
MELKTVIGTNEELLVEKNKKMTRAVKNSI